LKWGGAVENSERGVWHLTRLGQAMSDDDLRGLWKRIVAEQRARRKVKTQKEVAANEDEIPDEQGEIPEKPWKERLLDVLFAMDGKGFERLCQRLLRESGFIKVEITGRSGDGGIDWHRRTASQSSFIPCPFPVQEMEELRWSIYRSRFSGSNGGSRRQTIDPNNRKFHSGCQARSYAGWSTSY
jgi:hypothetical protein